MKILTDIALATAVILSPFVSMRIRLPGLYLIHLIIMLWIVLGIAVLLCEILEGRMTGYRSLGQWLLAGLLWPWVRTESRKTR
jgi:hypothetical protein